MEKYRTMSEAAGLAKTLTKMWLMRDTGEYVDEQGLDRLAYAMDEEMGRRSDEPPHVFLCSKEGAVGITYDFEYNAQWFLFPISDEKAMAEEMVDYVSNTFDAVKLLSRDQLVGIARKNGMAPKGPKFCVNCGAPVEPGEKFCARCGNKI